MQSSTLRSDSQTILVVDDEPFVLDVLGVVLRQAGYHVLQATSGLAALSAVAAHRGPVHLLVADVLMPGLNGPELAQELACLHPETRFLFTAGLPDSPVVKDFVVAPGYELLPKPFLPGALLRKVQELMGRRAVSA